MCDKDLKSRTTRKSTIDDTHQCRGERWSQKLGSADLRFLFSTQAYEHLVQCESRHDAKIKRDISRTFPSHPLFSSKSREQALFRILHAYSVFDPEIGYCQGMAFIAGTLKMHMDEEEAFWCFCQILGAKFNLRVVYDGGNPALHECMSKFDHYLKLYLPHLHKHLKEQNVKGFMYNPHWFLTFFVYRCRFDLIPRIWDMIFEHGVIVVYKLGLAILEHFQETLLQMEFEQLLPYFNHLPDFPEEVVSKSCHIDVCGLTVCSVDLFRFGWSHPDPEETENIINNTPISNNNDISQNKKNHKKRRKTMSVRPVQRERPLKDRSIFDRLLNILLGLPYHYTPPPKRTLVSPKGFLEVRKKKKKSAK